MERIEIARIVGELWRGDFDGAEHFGICDDIGAEPRLWVAKRDVPPLREALRQKQVPLGARYRSGDEIMTFPDEAFEVECRGKDGPVVLRLERVAAARLLDKLREIPV